MSAIGKVEDQAIDIVTIGALIGGGFLIYKFLPELQTAGKLADKLGDEAGKLVDTSTGVVSSTVDVLEDTFSGDLGQATQDLYKMPVVGKIAVSVDKLFGSYRPPPTPSYEEQALADKETYLPRLGELEKFNDWRPEVCQTRIDKAIRSGTAGNLYQILRLHQNHLAHGVLGNRGSIARMDFIDGTVDANANAFMVGTITKDQILVHASEYGRNESLVGFAWYLSAGLGVLWYDWNNREHAVQILNSVRFRNNYTVATNLGGQPDSVTMKELRLLDALKISVKAGDDGFLKFSLADIPIPAGLEDPWSQLCPGNTECWKK